MALGARLKSVIRAARGPAPGDAPQAFPAGAFYSPVVDAAEVLAEPDASRIWPPVAGDPPGIDVRAEAQLALLGRLGAHRFPLDPPSAGSDSASASSDDAPRYDPGNDQFPSQDAALLYAMVRHAAPRQVVEVGCGWSTIVTVAAIADGDLATRLTCIEPYPRPFLRAMGDLLILRQEKVEHTPPEVFDRLGAGDVLFIDSSHVAKTGSDVVHLLLEVVPRLADGVLVHVHDVFLPEDYPQGWVRAGFNWNEQYLLQAFLVGNARAHVVAMNRWLARRHPGALVDAFGPMAHDGSSLWFVTGPPPVTG